MKIRELKKLIHIRGKIQDYYGITILFAKHKDANTKIMVWKGVPKTARVYFNSLTTALHELGHVIDRVSNPPCVVRMRGELETELVAWRIAERLAREIDEELDDEQIDIGLSGYIWNGLIQGHLTPEKIDNLIGGGYVEEA